MQAAIKVSGQDSMDTRTYCVSNYVLEKAKS